MRTSSRILAVALFEELDLLALTGFVHVVSIAGRQWNWRPFRVVAVAEAPGPVTTRNQLEVNAATAFSNCMNPELIFVPGGYGARKHTQRSALVQWLKQVSPAATHLLTVGAGAFPLGLAGLLEGQQVAIDSELGHRLQETEPTVTIVDTPGVLSSGRLLSVAQTAASLDLGLHLVSSVLGKKQAGIVRAQLGYEPAGRDVADRDVDVVLQSEPPRR